MSSERSSKAASDLPDLDQLAALVDNAGASAPSDTPSETDSAASSDSPNSEEMPVEAREDEVDDGAPTDYFHAVKPKPKAVPIADVGTDDQPQLEEERPRRWVWGWIAAAAGLTGALAVVGVLHHDQTSAPAGPTSRPVPAAKLSQRAGGVQQRPSRPVSAGWDSATGDVSDPGSDPQAASVAPGAPIRVRFERRGQAILVPVRIGGPAGTRLLKMVLDTGATFSTVTRKTLAALGGRSSRVKARVETANGVVTRPLAVVESVALDGAAVTSGLTVGVCDACALAGTDGLLGLNFARHFVVTVDHDAGQLLLAPKLLGDKTMDIRPFVKLLDAKSQRRGDGVTIRFVIRNNAPRALRDLRIEATSPGLPTKPSAKIAYLAAGARRTATIEGRLAGEGGARTFTLEVVRASW